MAPEIRKFESGATRDVETGKLDYDGFLSPLVLRAFAEFMHVNRVTADGYRDSDNWQKGIPQDVYRKSAWRHFMSWWTWLRGWFKHESNPIADALGVMFNVNGWLHEYIKEDPSRLDEAIRYMNDARAAEIRQRKAMQPLKVGRYGDVDKVAQAAVERTGPASDYLAQTGGD